MTPVRESGRCDEKMIEKKKIAVGLSGGVDSAVTVKKLLSEGFDVIGVYLDMHLSDSEAPVLLDAGSSLVSASCDVRSALQCADSYGIPLYVYGCRSDFEKYVIENFAREYALGRTPNPCTVCNRHVKFASLLRAAELLGCEKIATGHYAKVGLSQNGRWVVRRGDDEKKEQSYMLWTLSQDQLSKVLFPLGDTVKPDNFEAARSDGLLAAERKESLDICFIGKDDDYASFIERRIGKFPEGDFIAPDGSVCGRHKGIIHYTVGQRKGLGVALGVPVFVKKIDGKENKIYLAESGNEYSDSLVLSGLNFVGLPETEELEGDLFVKIRYAAKPVPAHFKIDGETCRVDFPEKVRAVTPGQSAVFYDGDTLMFGGVID